MKDALTYAHDAGFFSFNVIGWKAEFERLIEAVRADAIADHVRDATNMVILTEEAAQQIEVTITLSLGYFPETVDGGVAIERAKKSLAAIRAARAQADHIAGAGKVIGCAYCDNPLFAGTKCNNCGRVTLAEQAEQEPIGVVAPNNGISWRIGQEPLPPRTKLYAASRPEQEPVALRFPTHLRKMWSGSEVQAWIDEQLAEQAEQEPVAAIKECLTAANTKIPAFLRRAGSFGD